MTTMTMTMTVVDCSVQLATAAPVQRWSRRLRWWCEPRTTSII